MNIISELEAEQSERILSQRRLPEFSPGDTLRVSVRVTEGNRTRVQVYEGVCIARKGSGLNESFTVRKISYGEGVERVFPVFSPLVEGIEVVRRGRVRRAKLYYLRDRRGKSARIVENTGSRAKGLADADREAFLAEKARLEAERIESAQQLAVEKAAEDAAAEAASETESSADAEPPADKVEDTKSDEPKDESKDESKSDAKVEAKQEEVTDAPADAEPPADETKADDAPVEDATPADDSSPDEQGESKKPSE